MTPKRHARVLIILLIFGVVALAGGASSADAGGCDPPPGAPLPPGCSSPEPPPLPPPVAPTPLPPPVEPAPSDPVPGPPAGLGNASGYQMTGECWKDGTRLYWEPLGDQFDPGFPARAQDFLERCRAQGGEAKFVPSELASPPSISPLDTRGRAPARVPKKLVVPVALSAPSEQSVKVAYRTVRGTALPGRDYRHVYGVLVFRPGETRQEVAIPLLPDRGPERPEVFFVKLSAPEYGVIVRDLANVVVLPRVLLQDSGCDCKDLKAAPASEMVKGKRVALEATAANNHSRVGRDVTWPLEIRIPWDTTIECGKGTGTCSGLLSVEIFKGGRWTINGQTATVQNETHEWPRGASEVEKLFVKCSGPCSGKKDKTTDTVYKVTLKAKLPEGQDKVTSVSGEIRVGLKTADCGNMQWNQAMTYRYTLTEVKPDPPKTPVGSTKTSEEVEMDSDGDGISNAKDSTPWGKK